MAAATKGVTLSGMEALRTFVMSQFERALDEKLPEMERALESTAKRTSLTVTLKIGRRKDEDFDVQVNGGCSSPFNGEVGKARLEGGQVILL